MEETVVYDEETIRSILKAGIDRKASDLFIIPGSPITYEIGHEHVKEGESLKSEHVHALIEGIYKFANRDMRLIEESLDDDFSVAADGIGRFRVNVYHQRNSLAAVIRVIQFGLPKPEDFMIPPEVMRAADLQQGLVLVTGPTGSGKSTTLACIVDRINHTKCGHIVTVEDPIEFIHRHGKSLISQREIGTDVETYEKALASALREHPSTIMFGEMRTRSVIEVSMRAAETGQLMLSSLHTLGAAATITRIIDTFPAEQQAQARAQLAQVLEAVISQKLVPSADGTSRVPVFEIMYSNHAIRNLIRENKPHQIDSIIQANAAEGMRTFDSDLIRLCKEGRITKDIALLNSINTETVKRQLG